MHKKINYTPYRVMVVEGENELMNEFIIALYNQPKAIEKVKRRLRGLTRIRHKDIWRRTWYKLLAIEQGLINLKIKQSNASEFPWRSF